jgi:hypothetical protein
MRSSQKGPWADFRLCPIALLGDHPWSARHEIVGRLGVLEFTQQFSDGPGTKLPEDLAISQQESWRLSGDG